TSATSASCPSAGSRPGGSPTYTSSFLLRREYSAPPPRTATTPAAPRARAFRSSPRSLALGLDFGSMIVHSSSKEPAGYSAAIVRPWPGSIFVCANSALAPSAPCSQPDRDPRSPYQQAVSAGSPGVLRVIRKSLMASAYPGPMRFEWLSASRLSPAPALGIPAAV